MAVATLALAIGANTAVFGVADAVLFRPLPYGEPDRLYLLRAVNENTGRRSTAVARDSIELIGREHRGLGPVADRGPSTIVSHTSADGTERMSAVTVSANYFDVLGVDAARGRLFAQEDAADPGGRAVLSYNSWQRRFGGDEGIVGRVVHLGSRERHIIGVLPEGFIFPAEFLLFPYGLSGAPEYVTLSPPLSARARRRPVLNPIVRLESDVTHEQAQAELDVLLGPAAGTASPSRIVLDEIRPVVFPVATSTMSALVAAAGLVLLLGSANLAGMFLARARRRQYEIGVCIALGATRSRLARPILFEALLIGIAGAALALVATSLTYDILLRQVPPMAYGDAKIGLDPRVAVFTVSLGLASGVLFAVAPAWHLRRLDPLALLRRRDGRTERRAAQTALVAAQVAIAVVLTFGAALAGRAVVSVLRAPLGFDPSDVLTIELRAPGDEPGERRAFYRQTLDGLRARQDVLAAGAAGALPLDSTAPEETVTDAAGDAAVGIVHITPGYFDTIGVPLLRGRPLSRSEFDAGGDVAIVSASAARALFPDSEPVGRTFTTSADRRLTVVGVVRDVQQSFEDWPPVAYAIPETFARDLRIVARMRQQAGSLADTHRAIGRTVPGEPVTVRRWADTISNLPQYRNRRFQALVLGGFAGVALGLTALGTFAAVAFLVASRRREIGIRMAIGASRSSVVRLCMQRGLFPVLAGIVPGLFGAWWIGRVVESRLYEVEGQDPAALIVGTVVVGMAAALAALLAARHAARVDPIAVLSAE